MLVRSYVGYTHSVKVGTLLALTETLVVDKESHTHQRKPGLRICYTSFYDWDFT